jgi:phosphoribosylglycinamide formyltransferase-1
VTGRAAVLASAVGTNLQALLDDAWVGHSIVLVVSDRPGAGALDRARASGVETLVMTPSDHPSPEAYDRALAEALEDREIEFVFLAGFMRILGPAVVRSFPDRILNVHPSLLPAFPGAHAPRDALAWGAKVSGCTVHIVDEEVDHGPIVLQEAVPVLPEDDANRLHARIREVEHRLYPRAARLLIEGRLKVEGRIVHVLGEDGGEEETE